MRRNQGFTLIELIVVLVVMGIIAGVTVPRYTSSFDSIKFRRTMSELVCFLREARIKAMATAETASVTLDLKRGFCWNDDKKILRIPGKIEMFTDKTEALDDQIKIFTFYPNGTALAEKMGFVSDKMVAVLHVEPLGGVSYYKINEDMEQVVLYARNEDELSDEEIEKEIDKLRESDTLAKNEQTADKDTDKNLYGMDNEYGDNDSDDGTGSFGEDDDNGDDEGMDDE